MARDVSSDKTLLKNLLATKHAIPDYQREYVWNRKIIGKLLDDLEVHSVAYPHDVDSPYFMGSLMRVPEPPAGALVLPMHISDGQQRLIALTCLTAAVRDQLLLYHEYVEAWELHQSILADGTDERLIMHNSGDNRGADSQVDWALRPRKVTMKPRVKMRFQAGVPSRIRSEHPINLPWSVCRVIFNKLAQKRHLHRLASSHPKFNCVIS